MRLPALVPCPAFFLVPPEWCDAPYAAQRYDGEASPLQTAPRRCSPRLCCVGGTEGPAAKGCLALATLRSCCACGWAARILRRGRSATTPGVEVGPFWRIAWARTSIPWRVSVCLFREPFSEPQNAEKGPLGARTRWQPGVRRTGASGCPPPPAMMWRRPDQNLKPETVVATPSQPAPVLVLARRSPQGAVAARVTVERLRGSLGRGTQTSSGSVGRQRSCRRIAAATARYFGVSAIRDPPGHPWRRRLGGDSRRSLQAPVSNFGRQAAATARRVAPVDAPPASRPECSPRAASHPAALTCGR